MTKFFAGVSRKKKIVLGVSLIALIGVGAAFVLFNQKFSADTANDPQPNFKISLQASAKSGSVTAIDLPTSPGGYLKTLDVPLKQTYTIKWSTQGPTDKIKRCGWFGENVSDTFFDGHTSTNPVDYSGSRTYTAVDYRNFAFQCDFNDSKHFRYVGIKIVVKAAPTAAPTPTPTPTPTPAPAD